MKTFPLLFCSILNSVTFVVSWRSFDRLITLEAPHTMKNASNVHIEYIFGDCFKKDINLIYNISYTDKDLIGNVIIRGWTPQIRLVPTCIIIRGESDTYKSADYPGIQYSFQICVPRITIIHTRKRFRFYFFEWYIPVGFISHLKWTLNFYYKPRDLWE